MSRVPGKYSRDPGERILFKDRTMKWNSWWLNLVYFLVGGVLITQALGGASGLGFCLLALYITGKLER